MEFIGIFWKNNIWKAYLPKGSIVEKIVPFFSDDSIQIPVPKPFLFFLIWQVFMAWYQLTLVNRRLLKEWQIYKTKKVFRLWMQKYNES